jgi:hypothetical protein
MSIYAKVTRLITVGLFVAAPVFAIGQADKRPAACGPKGTTFEISQDETPHPQETPKPGKALVYFIQDSGPDGHRQHYTLRVAVDGAWVGAYRQNSYFVVPIDPGEHHVCAESQSGTAASKNLALAHFTAEAGKTYYFSTKFMAGVTTMYPISPSLVLDRPDSDEAAYLIATYPLGLWKTHN